MAEDKSRSESKTKTVADPLGTDRGFIGGKVDPRPNSDHSLESGPEGVPADVGHAEGRAAATE